MLKCCLLKVVAISAFFGRMDDQLTKSREASVESWQAGVQGCDVTESIPVGQNFHVAYRQVAISNVLGLHLRAAAKFVRSAQAFESAVKVRSNGIVADGRSILDLISLAAECGTMLAVEADGCDAEDAVAALANLISAQSVESEDQTGLAAG